MLRKHLLFYALACLVAFGLSNCSYYDDPSAPGKSSVTVDQNSGLSGITEFTFTVTQVAAQNISLLPEGEGKPGVLIDASAFTNGKATVKYTYADVGVFKAVIRTASSSPDGKTIKTSVSDPVTVTVTSHENKIKEFSFVGPNSTSTTIIDKDDTDVDTINVVVPYNPFHAKTLNSLKATFTTSDFATVKVGSTDQTSGETANNFSTPLNYVVTAADGTTTRTYTVTVTIMAVGTDYSIKSANGIVLADGGLNQKKFSAYVDNTAGIIAVVLPYGSDDAVNSAKINFNYELNDTTARGDLSLKSDEFIDLSGSNTKTLRVTAQDGTTKDYTIYSVIGPQFNITITNINPTSEGTVSDLSISISVLKGTDLSNLDFTFTTMDASVSQVKYNNVGYATNAVVSADYSVKSPQNWLLKTTADATKGSITYWATYSVDVLPVH